ncbi:MAG: hypothetical protein J6Y86_12145 [Pseudobutyrivibrio sp.]|nr:hypothetical protein [Pseudobutyrivibrio sp.]
MPYFSNNPYQQNYNNPYQQSYAQNQQSYAQNYNPPQMQMAQPTQSSTINWVQGDVGARAYPVQPGMSVLLMDSEGQNFYIKSADNMGMPNLKKYAYSEVIEEPMRLESHEAKQIDTAFTATREEVKKMQEEINNLKEQIKRMEDEKQSGGRKNG